MKLSSMVTILLVTCSVTACSFKSIPSSPIHSSSPPGSFLPSNSREPRILANCTSLGENWSKFVSTITNLSFCYPTGWGNPLEQASTEHQSGKMWAITFSQASKEIHMYYFTANFAITGPRDPMMLHEEICLTCIDTTMNTSRLQTALKIPNDIFKTVARFDRNGHFGIMLEKNFTSPLAPTEQIHEFVWLFPQALKNDYTLVFSTPATERADMENVVKSSVF